MVREPAPSTRAPIAFRKFARSTTSGSRAADSITVVPRANTAAIIRLSVPSTVGPLSPRISTVVPTRPFGASMSMLPPFTRTRAPRAWMPRRCRSTGRSPIRHPPGSGRVQRCMRAISGPSRQMDARILRTWS